MILGYQSTEKQRARNVNTRIRRNARRSNRRSRRPLTAEQIEQRIIGIAFFLGGAAITSLLTMFLFSCATQMLCTI
jgi:cell division septal protein FtsQ